MHANAQGAFKWPLYRIPPKTGFLDFGRLCLDFYVMKETEVWADNFQYSWPEEKKIQREMENIQMDVCAPKSNKCLIEVL